MASKSYELMDLLESFPPISGDFIFLEGKKGILVNMKSMQVEM